MWKTPPYSGLLAQFAGTCASVFLLNFGSGRGQGDPVNVQTDFFYPGGQNEVGQIR